LRRRPRKICARKERDRDQKTANQVRRSHADPAAWQGAVRSNLLIAAAIDDVVQAHPEPVEPGRHHDDRYRPLPMDVLQHGIAWSVPPSRPNQKRAQRVGDRREDQGHPGELQDRKQSS
jgi:hypothetical protein